MILTEKELLENPTISDFIKTELTNEKMKNELYDLITNHLNIVSFEYECNQYNVLYDRDNKIITIRDAVSEEHSIPEYCERVVLSVDDFLKIFSLQ